MSGTMLALRLLSNPAGEMLPAYKQVPLGKRQQQLAIGLMPMGSGWNGVCSDGAGALYYSRLAAADTGAVDG